jgi:hypothetical protein
MEGISRRDGATFLKTTVRMTSAMRESLRNAAKAYGGKGKSRWVREALEALNADDPCLTTVGHGESAFVPECSDQVILGPGDSDLLEQMVARIRKQDPLAEGVQSQILRAAIRGRLQRST